jgi:hypothetical protein
LIANELKVVAKGKFSAINVWGIAFLLQLMKRVAIELIKVVIDYRVILSGNSIQRICFLLLWRILSLRMDFRGFFSIDDIGLVN